MERMILEKTVRMLGWDSPMKNIVMDGNIMIDKSTAEDLGRGFPAFNYPCCSY